LEGRPADRLFVEMRSTSKRGVDDQGDCTALYLVDNVWTAFIDLENRFNFPQCLEGSDMVEINCT